MTFLTTFFLMGISGGSQGSAFINHDAHAGVAQWQGFFRGSPWWLSGSQPSAGPVTPPPPMATGRRGQLWPSGNSLWVSYPEPWILPFLWRFSHPDTPPAPFPCSIHQHRCKKEGKKKKLILIRCGSYRLWGEGGKRVILMKLISNWILSSQI